MIPALLLLLSAVAFRITTGLMIHSGATWLSNFAPLAAVALCGAAYLPTKYKFAVPLSALFISDAVLNYHYNASLLDPLVLCRYLALGLVCFVGFSLAARASWRTLLPASLAGTCIFYLITNVFAWLTDPGYAKNAGGLVQSLTVGLPAYSSTPTWMFFRNSLLGDLFFTALFVVCMRLGRSMESSTAARAVPRPA